MLLWQSRTQSGALREIAFDSGARLWPVQQSSGRPPSWESAATRFAVRVLCFSADGQTVWGGDARGALTARDASSGPCKARLRLLPTPANSVPVMGSLGQERRNHARARAIARVASV